MGGAGRAGDEEMMRGFWPVWVVGRAVARQPDDFPPSRGADQGHAAEAQPAPSQSARASVQWSGNAPHQALVLESNVLALRLGLAGRPLPLPPGTLLRISRSTAAGGSLLRLLLLGLLLRRLWLRRRRVAPVAALQGDIGRFLASGV